MTHDVTDLLNAVTGTRSRREAEALEGRAPSTFSPLRFCRTDEVGLSGILAWLLDPREDHGHGTAFLHEFARTFGLDPERLGNPRCVVTEMPTDQIGAARRIDIAIECAGYTLAIENKPWAGFQDRQVPDYCLQLERKTGGNYHIVILKGRAGAAPLLQTAPGGRANEKVIDADYGAVTEWLEACAKLAGEPRVRNFIEDLRDNLADTVLGRSNIRESRMVLEAIDTLERRRAALDVIAAADALYRTLHRELLNVLRSRCPERWRVSGERTGRAGRGNPGFHHVTIDADRALPVVFVLDLPHYSGDAQLGVVKREKAGHVVRKLDRIAGRLHERVMDARDGGPWIWWQFTSSLAEAGLMEMEVSSDVWKDVLEPGQFAAQTINLVERLLREARLAIRGM